MNDPRLKLAPSLAGVLPERLLGALDALRPVVYVGHGLSGTATASVGSLIAMLGRLFPHLCLEGAADMGPNPWGASTLRECFDICAPTRPTPTCPATRDLIIGVGSATDRAELAMGGDDWTVRLGPGSLPVASGGFGLGLQMAAALLCSEIMKQALGPLGMMHHSLHGHLVWNLIDHKLEPAQGAPSAPAHGLNLALLGAGSIGSSVAGVLSCMPTMTGVVDVVDGDSFDPASNSFRYPAATGSEAGSKAAWLGAMLGRAGFQALPFCGTVADWVGKTPSPGYNGMVISSVDGIEGRLEVSDVLARTTISVGVAGLALHVQREILGDGWACPFCDFVDAAPALTQAHAWAQLVGLRMERVVQLIVGDGRLVQADVDAAVRAGHVSHDSAADLVGRRLADLIGRAYAEAVVSAPGAPSVRVAAPHVSWAGGVLAAAEAVKGACGMPLVDRRVDLDLSGLPTGFVRRNKADLSGNCVCASPIRLRWMKRMYVTT